ncbi:hypothetical protein HYY74_01600 [Candidatus Woesearchaeota archaeon]|nr:hypothetical protein [Candidatus Woesearchaeota archaeon]
MSNLYNLLGLLEEEVSITRRLEKCTAASDASMKQALEQKELARNFFIDQLFDVLRHNLPMFSVFGRRSDDMSPIFRDYGLIQALQFSYKPSSPFVTFPFVTDYILAAPVVQDAAPGSFLIRTFAVHRHKGHGDLVSVDGVNLYSPLRDGYRIPSGLVPGLNHLNVSEESGRRLWDSSIGITHSRLCAAYLGELPDIEVPRDIFPGFYAGFMATVGQALLEHRVKNGDAEEQIYKNSRLIKAAQSEGSLLGRDLSLLMLVNHALEEPRP